MDGEVGQLAVHDNRFGYSGGPFFHHQFIAGNTLYKSKPDTMTAISNGEAPDREDHHEAGESAQSMSRGWEGFSFMALNGFQNWPHGGKPPVNAYETERVQIMMPSDLRLASTNGNVAAGFCKTEQRRKQNLFNNLSSTQHIGATSIEKDAGELVLKLSPGSFACPDDSANGARHTKRFRPSSPGSQSHVCQVDDCHTDLKTAKDYHRRHKVCELHSKAPQSLVHTVMQRFCQQCSRFHPLPEFDEGKRSCRRRLAGHNKRRRKTDVATNGAPLSEVVNGNTDLLSLVAILSQLQAAKAKEKPDAHSMEYESILQVLRKAASYPSLSTTLIRDALSGTSQILSGPNRLNQETQAGTLGPLGGLSKEALLVVLRNFVAAQVSAWQGRMAQMPQVPQSNDQNVGLSSPEDLPRMANTIMDSLPLVLTGKSCKSSGESDPGELCIRQNITRQYLGQAASYSTEAGPDSSPDSMVARPLEEQNFFPTESGGGFRADAAGMEDRAVYDSSLHFQEEYLNLSPFDAADCTLGGDKPIRQGSDSSEFGSDQSPASSSSGGQELSGRILFKLCDPNRMSNMTETHHSELQQWLSIKPGWMESVMRPGCILLTVFLSMPHRSWEELLANLRGSLKRLVRSSQSELWSRGRIVVQVGHQRGLIVNGKVKRIRFSRTRKGPSLRSVRPLAVEAGQEATLTVSGYNLVPQTRIVCVYHGRYVLYEVPSQSSDGASSPSSFPRSIEQVHEMHFPGGPPNILGRCFIEVEHDFMGTFLPVIVADKAICSELRSLEGELDLSSSWKSEQSEDSSPEDTYVNKEAEAMHFLHELGWIFQITSRGLNPYRVDVDPSYSISASRFKGLLKYAVLRDWCAVVSVLLDLLFSMGTNENAEELQVLREVNLLHQAVKRKCRLMVELLLQYVPNGGSTIFTPVMEGPGGLTPLHTAASMLGAEDIIDALTEDPREVGLHGWKSAHDHAGRTPEWHAQNRGNFSYVQLIERKLSNKLLPSVRITVDDLPISALNYVKDCDLSLARTGIVGDQDTMIVELSSFSKQATSSSVQQACRDCRKAARLYPFRLSGAPSRMYRPLMTMMVAVAAVCATVALLFRGSPLLDSVLYSLKWDGISYGAL